MRNMEISQYARVVPASQAVKTGSNPVGYAMFPSEAI